MERCKAIIVGLMLLVCISGCRQRPTYFIEQVVDPHKALTYRIYAETPGLGDYDEALEVCNENGDTCTRLLQTRGYSTIAARWMLDENLGESSGLEIVVDGPIYNARSVARGSVGLMSKSGPLKVHYSAYITQCNPCGPQCTEHALALLNAAKVKRGRHLLRDVTPRSERNRCDYTSPRNRIKIIPLTPAPSPR